MHKPQHMFKFPCCACLQVFEMNPLEYIRRDAEGSDSDTRRRAAADLVKSLTVKFPAQVTQLCTGYVQVRIPGLMYLCWWVFVDLC